jgi:hypothetical protein
MAALLLLALLGLLLMLCARANAAGARPIAPVDADAVSEVTDDEAAVDLEPGGAPDQDAPFEVNAPTTVAMAHAPAVLPPISLVLAAAYHAASLDQSPVASWRWRARLAGLVPTVTIRDGRDATWRDVADPTIGYVSVFTVSATWRLDRLLFDSNELRISAIDAARRRERRHLMAIVIHYYYVLARAAAGAQADEAAAELDALTDGWFSQALARNHR